MNILITGVCGFVGSTLARAWVDHSGAHSIVGVDNLIRPGSELNRLALRRYGVQVRHADIRCPSDFDSWPACDVVVDAAANPSVLAGVDGVTSSRQLVEHNLTGTVNILEYCRRHAAAFVLLSTSRVYSMAPLSTLPTRVVDQAFVPDDSQALPAGVSAAGVSERFSTDPPISLYGSTKRASELLALEYGLTFDFPVFINRCGVMAGAGQFGRADQGIFAFWINSWLRRRPLAFIGYEGRGHQVRDCLHPADLVPLLERQLKATSRPPQPIVNVSGGMASAMSLKQLSDWCLNRLGDHAVEPRPAGRQFDVPWMVLDATGAADLWQWQPTRSRESILTEILEHAQANPEWLEISSN